MSFQHYFAAPVLDQRRTRGYFAVRLPLDVSQAYREAQVRRVIVEVDQYIWRRAVIPVRDGPAIVRLSRAMLKALGASPGDTLLVHVRPDPEPDRVDLCDELVAALEVAPLAAAWFDSLTPGRQRSLVHQVNLAKQSGTRARRADRLIRMLEADATGE